MLMTIEKRNEIIKDLIKKFPAGPNDKLKKSDYHMVHVYHDIYERYTDIPVLGLGTSTCLFGYDEETFFDQGIECSNSALEAVREIFPGDSRRKCNRRARVLAYRCARTWRNFRNKGGTGVYKIMFGYRSRAAAYVHGISHEEAKSVGLTLTGLYGVDPGNTEIRSTFMELGAPSVTQDYNNRLARRIVNEAERLVHQQENALVELREKLEESKKTAGLLRLNASFQVNLHTEEEMECTG
jgi:hypothetical protein